MKPGIVKETAARSRRAAQEALARSDSLAKETLDRPPFHDENGPEAETGTEKGAPSLETLSVRGLHDLERLDSEIRHSVVELCFYNLKLLCQVFEEKYSQPQFREKFRREAGELASVRKRLDEYFRSKLDGDTTVSSLFPEEVRAIEEDVEAVDGLLRGWESRCEEASYRQALRTAVPEKIDSVMGKLLRVKETLGKHKVDIGELLHRAVDLHAEHLRTHNIDVIIDVAASLARIFVQKGPLLDIFCEIIRNAIKHGFMRYEGPQKKTIEIRAAEGGAEAKMVTISFSDNGSGIDIRTLKAMRGPVRQNSGLSIIQRVVVDEHSGNVTVDGAPGKGMTITIDLPAKM